MAFIGEELHRFSKVRENVRMNMSVPNFLTLLRISIIPIFAICYYLPFKWAYMLSAILFTIGALTDLLDGYLARKLKQVSSLGAFLDPVADKLMVAVALVLLVQAHANLLMTIPAVIIICREILISALREWMAELGKRQKVAVSYIGKLKTAGQMIAIALLLSQDPSSLSLLSILGFLMIYAAAVLTVWSMFVYLQTAIIEAQNLDNSTH